MTGDVVVVLSYRGRQDTEACVQSLVSGSPDATVLVVDNGSGDGVLESVSRRWPGVRTLANTDNLGFAGGMNTGIRWALAHGAKTITVLNNDTVLPDGAVAALAWAARNGAAVSPEVRYADRPDEVWFGGGTIDEDTGLARHLAAAELDSVPLPPDGLRPTEVLAGCCVTATATTWRRVGLFDEAYFLNFEDSDWSLRARRARVPLLVDTGTVIEHKVSASFTGEYGYLGLFYYVRNAMIFVRQSWGGGPAHAARLLRCQVLPGLVRLARRGEWRELRRRVLVTATALACYLLRRTGRAPRWLEGRARRWSGA